MKIDADLYGLPDDEAGGLGDDVVRLSEAAEEIGFDGVWSHETSSDGFLPLALTAEHTEEITFGTRIALAFTRSPMVLAYTAWDLARYSNGRFVLGLGTQVKGHNERRFSVDWTAPTPRLRETIESIRHIWDVFQNPETELDYQGDHYSFSLMTDQFNPGPIEDPDIPIHIAAVNEHNLRLAGQLCDGVCVHAFNSPEYVEEFVHPTVKEGTEDAGRSFDDVEVSVHPFTITGRTDEEMEKAREKVRRLISFYGSTRTYHDVLEFHGWKDVGEELHELSKEQKWEEMEELVTPEMVDTFAIEAPMDSIGRELRRTYDGVADRAMLYTHFDGEEYWRTIVDQVRGSSEDGDGR